MAIEGGSKLRQVGEDREIPSTGTANPTDNVAALNLLLLSLRTLSQRTLLALVGLFNIVAVGSVWWLFDNDIPTDPSIHQIIALALYGAFVLTVIWLKRKGA